MPNQQKYRPISFRPPEADRLWLLEHAKATGQAVNRILVAALAEYRLRHEQALERSRLRPAHSPPANAAPATPSKEISEETER